MKAGLGQDQESSVLLGGAGSGDVAFGFSEAFWDEHTPLPHRVIFFLDEHYMFNIDIFLNRLD